MTANTRRNVVYSSTHEAVIEDHPIPDIDATPGFEDIFARSRNFTMTSKEVMFSTYQAACYVARRGIPGDIVECGVWRTVGQKAFQHLTTMSITLASGVNQQLPQSALGSKTPLQAVKDWHKLKPELFKKQPYYLPGCDT